MQSSYSLYVFLLVTFPAITSAMSLKGSYRRPVCEPAQSCSYSFQQFTFELCDCPNSKGCPMDNGVQLKGVTYQFCNARDLPICTTEKYAAEITRLQTSIICVCPDDQIYVKHRDDSNNAKYVCQEDSKPVFHPPQNYKSLFDTECTEGQTDCMPKLSRSFSKNF